MSLASRLLLSALQDDAPEPEAPRTSSRGVDSRLKSILTAAAEDSPFKVKFISEYRPGDKRQHGKGRAIDVQLIDRDTGKALANYQDARHFRDYEQFAQRARAIQQQQYPELDRAFRWGGYFSGKKNYGALDLMHFDLGGFDGLGMAGGQWATGLTAAQRKLWPGIVSQGMATPEAPKFSLAESLLQSVLRDPPTRTQVSRPQPVAASLSRADWIAQMRQHAAPVAQRLGLDPDFLIAHAAQETGWGKYVRDNNLFNITGSIGGLSALRGDTDARGRATKQRFRVYDSPAKSFSDLADQLTRNFPKALNTPNILAYGTGLENGRLGRYAEDPKYAQHLQERYNELKSSAPSTQAPSLTDHLLLSALK